ncbi:hypothetical protein LTR37_010189 [Vermiconidia calcicola]|uniref:Uncharacterized protein n=1 Tax=Vermiconidia calcicola TaxID=1690605 RepID=A0ACC3N8A9_9PEZI|nr:hypothetical protein LTR37_010189 [Vermiconidia calcicola]
MQHRYAIFAILFALYSAQNVAGRHAIQRRQDPETTAPASITESTITSSDQSTPTSAVSSEQTSTDDAQRKTTASGTSEDRAATTLTTSRSKATPTTASLNATAAAAKKEQQEEKLPIQPSITPALGIAGAILIISGLSYTIIGIKHQWLLVFLSSAYLAALAVVVLIIYVMNPPVSDAIQGAYMVAALLTGLAFGGVSLVFRDVTEGLSCLLGGFCLSMWFLVLKPGGLIADPTGRAIMIGVFSAVGWSVYFSQHTRNYGMILCTAFAGAQITILGIDCFSRAGLKEFWLYIWNLNDQQFPIHTTTYPITRGIRVEIAGTIVLFLFGVLSQFKIWKVVKDRRTKREAQKLEESNQRDMRDSAIGKNVEANNDRSLAQWEAVYGNKDAVRAHPDSGMGTSIASNPKMSASVTEREIEMDHMGGIGRSKNGPSTIVEREVPRGLDLNLDDNDNSSWWGDYRSTKPTSHAGWLPSVEDSSLRDLEANDRQPVPGGPSVPPLPFQPPTTRNEKTPASPASKETALQEQSVAERRGVPLDNLALQKLNQQAPANLPRIEDDRASSMAATADDEPYLDDISVNRMSLAPSDYQAVAQKERLSPFSDHFQDNVDRSPATPKEDPMDENDDEMLLRPAATEEEPSQASAKRESAKQQQRSSSPGSRRRSTGSADSARRDGQESSKADDAASLQSLEGHLPESMSKVAMAYRTNEWAKHIADADQPMPEEANNADEPSVQVEVGQRYEEPRPVDPVALAETAIPDEQKAYKVTTNPYRQSKDNKGGKRKSSGPTPVYAFSRSSSYLSQPRQSSNNSATQQNLDTRKVSPPYSQQPLVESPIEDTHASGAYQNSSTPYLSTTNLLDERTSRLARRTTTTNFNALNTTPGVNIVSPSPEPGMHADGSDVMTTLVSDAAQRIPGEEDLSLAQRKSLLEQGRIRRSSAGTPALNRMNSTSNPNLIYDSHQPRRSTTVDNAKQNAMLTQWRQSLEQQGVPRSNPVAEEQARQAMLQQRHHAGYRKQREAEKRETRESMIDVAMRTGQLTSAHQKALRKMQDKANAG